MVAVDWHIMFSVFRCAVRVLSNAMPSSQHWLRCEHVRILMAASDNLCAARLALASAISAAVRRHSAVLLLARRPVTAGVSNAAVGTVYHEAHFFTHKLACWHD